MDKGSPLRGDQLRAIFSREICLQLEGFEEIVLATHALNVVERAARHEELEIIIDTMAWSLQENLQDWEIDEWPEFTFPFDNVEFFVSAYDLVADKQIAEAWALKDKSLIDDNHVFAVGDPRGLSIELVGDTDDSAVRMLKASRGSAIRFEMDRMKSMQDHQASLYSTRASDDESQP